MPHILRDAHETVLAAVRAWRDLPDRADDGWLLIRHGDRLFTAIRYGELRDVLIYPGMKIHLNTPLADLPYRRASAANPDRIFPGVVTPRVVDEAALAGSSGDVVVALRGDQVVSVVSASGPDFIFVDHSLLGLLEEFEQGGDDETHILRRDTSSTVIPPGKETDA